MWNEREFVVVTYSPMNTFNKMWDLSVARERFPPWKDRRAATDQIITYLLNYRIISISNYRKEIESYSERASSTISE